MAGCSSSSGKEKTIDVFISMSNLLLFEITGFGYYLYLRASAIPILINIDKRT